MFGHTALSMCVPVYVRLALDCMLECVDVQKHTRGCLHWSIPVHVLTVHCVMSVQEIANHMEKDTETYEVVQEAIDTMQRVAWHINDMKRKHEHAVRLQVRRAQKLQSMEW